MQLGSGRSLGARMASFRFICFIIYFNLESTSARDRQPSFASRAWHHDGVHGAKGWAARSVLRTVVRMRLDTLRMSSTGCCCAPTRHGKLNFINVPKFLVGKDMVGTVRKAIAINKHAKESLVKKMRLSTDCAFKGESSSVCMELMGLPLDIDFVESQDMQPLEPSGSKLDTCDATPSPSQDLSPDSPDINSKSAASFFDSPSVSGRPTLRRLSRFELD